MLMNVSSLTILCISPVLIPNPNFGHKFKAGDIFSLKDCTSRYIRVPCGKCDECISARQMGIVQRLQMEGLTHHIFFATLTYKDAMMPRVYTSTGVGIRYADIRDVQNMMKRIRNKNLFTRPFKYFAVSERGSSDDGTHRPHFHILFLVDKCDKDNWLDIMQLEHILYDVVFSQWKRKVGGSSRRPKFEKLFDYHEKWKGNILTRNFDLHYVSPRMGDDSCVSVGFYVIKYMIKDSVHERKFQQALRLNYDPEEYETLWKLVRSRYIFSRDFGSSKVPEVRKYIRECIDLSVKDKDSVAPSYFNPDDGRSFPLSRFYKSKFMTYEDALSYYYRSNNVTLDSVAFDDRDDVEITTHIQKYKSHHNDLKRILSAPTEFESDDCSDDGLWFSENHDTCQQ